MSKKIKLALANLQKAYLVSQKELEQSKENFLTVFLNDLKGYHLDEKHKSVADKKSLLEKLEELEELRDYFLLSAALELFCQKEKPDVSFCCKLLQQLITPAHLKEQGGKVALESCRVFTLELFYYFSSLLLKTDNYSALQEFLTHRYSVEGRKVNYTYLSNQLISLLSTREIARFMNSPQRRNHNFSDSDFPEIEILLFYASAFSSLYLLPSWQCYYAYHDFKIQGPCFFDKLILPNNFEKMKKIFGVETQAEFVAKAKLINDNLAKTSFSAPRFSIQTVG